MSLGLLLLAGLGLGWSADSGVFVSSLSELHRRRFLDVLSDFDGEMVRDVYPGSETGVNRSKFGDTNSKFGMNCPQLSPSRLLLIPWNFGSSLGGDEFGISSRLLRARFSMVKASLLYEEHLFASWTILSMCLHKLDKNQKNPVIFINVVDYTLINIQCEFWEYVVFSRHCMVKSVQALLRIVLPRIQGDKLKVIEFPSVCVTSKNISCYELVTGNLRLIPED